ERELERERRSSERRSLAAPRASPRRCPAPRPRSRRRRPFARAGAARARALPASRSDRASPRAWQPPAQATLFTETPSATTLRIGGTSFFGSFAAALFPLSHCTTTFT